MQKLTTTTSAATTSAAGYPAEAVDSDATTSMATEAAAEAAAEAATAAVSSHSPNNSCERGDSSGPAVSILCVCFVCIYMYI